MVEKINDIISLVIQMYKFSVFQKEIIINVLIFIMGIILDCIGVYMESRSWNVESSIAIGIGCSLIASSVVSFLSFLYRERRDKTNNSIGKAVQVLYRENMFDNVAQRVKKAKKNVDVCFLRGDIPYDLLKNGYFGVLLSKGVKIRIIVNDSKLIHNDKQTEFIELVKKMKDIYPNISLFISSDIRPFEWIRVDDLIMMRSYTKLSHMEKPTIMEIKEESSKELFEEFEKQFEIILTNAKYIV